MAEHNCHKFICEECQQPATHLHCLPLELNRDIQRGLHRGAPRLIIDANDIYVRYTIKSGVREKYQQTFDKRDYKLALDQKTFLLEQIKNFKAEQSFISSYSVGEGPMAKLLIPGISTCVVYVKGQRADEYLRISKRDAEYHSFYGMKYLPAFLEMLEDIEKRFLSTDEEE